MSMFFSSDPTGSGDSGQDTSGKTAQRGSMLDTVGLGGWFADDSKKEDEDGDEEDGDQLAGAAQGEAEQREKGDEPGMPCWEPYWQCPACGETNKRDRSQCNTCGCTQPGTSLNCPLCEELMHRPVRMTCGHHACAACLTYWFKKRARWTATAEQRCPECRTRLCSADGRSASLTADIDLERKIVAKLGAEAYHQRELEHAQISDESLGKKLEAYSEKQLKLNKASDVAMVGVGTAAVTTGSYMYLSGLVASTSTAVSTTCTGLATGSVATMATASGEASVAFWSTALSAEVASGAAVAGAVAGAGVAAFLGGMKLAAWLDDAGRYCILRGGDHDEETVPASSVCVLNLLGEPIRARVFKAKKVRINNMDQGKPSGALSAAESFVSFVGKKTGLVDDEEQEKARYDLEPQGEALAEVDIDGKREQEIRLEEPLAKRLMITISLHGHLIDTDLGTVSSRPGRRVIVCEVTDDAAKSVLDRRRQDDAAKSVLDRRRQEQIYEKGETMDLSIPCYWTADGAPCSFDEIPQTGAEFGRFQELLDTTFKRGASGRAHPTRDRAGLLPKRLQLTRAFRMQNKVLWEPYRQRCADLLKKRGKACAPVGDVKTMKMFTKEGLRRLQLRDDLNEVYVFHGTSPQAAMAIKSTGFDLFRAGKKHGAAFGDGLYFAECCSKSDEYAVDNPDDVLWKDHYALLLCRVVLGKVHRVTDFDPSAHITVPRQGCDSLLGDREEAAGTYREFIVYSEKQVYPEFVLIYKRET